MMFKTLVSVVLCSFGAVGSSFAAVDAGLLALVPPDAQVVVGVNVSASRDSDFGRYLSGRFNSEAKGLEQLTAETGFDPRRDLQALLFAGNQGASGKKTSNGLVLARGNFDQSKIRSAALAKGSLVQTFSGVEIYLPPAHAAQDQNAFAFLDSDVFAAGSLSGLRQAIASRSAPVPLPGQLARLITQAGTDNDIWFASSVPASRLPMHFQSDLDQSLNGSQALQSISAASGGIRFGSLVQVTLDAIARSDKDASSLVDVIRFGASLVQLKGQSDPRSVLLASALNQMMVSATGQNLHVALALPETTLEQFAEVRPRRRHMAR